MKELSLKKAWKLDLTKDRVRTLRKKEESSYRYVNFYNPPRSSRVQSYSSHLIDLRDDLSCRGKICQWTYSVVDHFQLSRETVAISIDLFDRYFATRGNKCDEDSALLASLTTLYIATKINEKKKIKSCLFSELSRDRYSSKDIEDMELRILSALSWFVHPPTTVNFINELVTFMPSSAPVKLCRDVFELSRYVAELAVCDPYFIKQDNSSIALAAILNVLDDEISREIMPKTSITRFLSHITHYFPWFIDDLSAVNNCRERLRDLVWEQGHESRDESSQRHKRDVSPMSVTGTRQNRLQFVMDE